MKSEDTEALSYVKIAWSALNFWLRKPTTIFHFQTEPSHKTPPRYVLEKDDGSREDGLQTVTLSYEHASVELPQLVASVDSGL